MTTPSSTTDPQGLVQPVIRFAMLVNLNPAPKKMAVRRFVGDLLGEWQALVPVLRRTLAMALGPEGVEVSFASDEQTRDMSQGGARVLETPLFRVTNSRHELALGIEALEGRVGAALCTSGLSTKVFCRLRPIKANPGSGATVSTNSLPHFAGLCRRLNKQLTKEVFDWLQTTARNDSVDFEITHVGELEVSALGIVDQSISDYFCRLHDSAISASEILEDKQADEKLSLYYSCFADDIKCRLSELSTLKSEAIWFSSPISVEVENGYLEPREVLYLLRGQDGVYQALGVGYDDSVKGNLALKSTNRVSRWLSNRM